MRKFSYKNLFKKLIDLDMTNNELMEKANEIKSTFYKIKNGQNVTTDVLLRICNTLDCDISEIVECEKVIWYTEYMYYGWLYNQPSDCRQSPHV